MPVDLLRIATNEYLWPDDTYAAWLSFLGDLPWAARPHGRPAHETTFHASAEEAASAVGARLPDATAP